MIKKEKTQYELIQEFLINDEFHFNHLMIKGIIKFLYEKFGSDFWKYIIDVVMKDEPSLFERFRKYKIEAQKSFNEYVRREH